MPRQPPTVFAEQRAVFIAHVKCLGITLREAAGNTQQKIREIAARLRAREGEGAVRLHVWVGVDLAVQKFSAYFDGVRADDAGKIVAQLPGVVVLVQPGDVHADGVAVEDGVLDALVGRPVGDDALRTGGGYKSLLRKGGPDAAHWGTKNVDVAHEGEMQFVHAARSEALGIA